MSELTSKADLFERLGRACLDAAREVLVPQLQTDAERAEAGVKAGLKRKRSGRAMTPRQRAARHDREIAIAYADLRRADGFDAMAKHYRRRVAVLARREAVVA